MSGRKTIMRCIQKGLTAFFIGLLSILLVTPSSQAIDIRVYDYHKAIQRMLNKDQKVVLGVIVDKVFTTSTGDWVESWRASIQHTQMVDLQNSILKYSGFNDYPKFSLVDRAGIEGVLKELNFQQTGYLSPKDQQKIGDILGITHIVFETYSRFPASAPYSYTDQADFRLVEIKTSRVLATDTVVANMKEDGSWTPWGFKTAPGQ